MEERAWLTTREAADLLGISLRDLYELIEDDRLAVHGGRPIRVEARGGCPPRPPG